MSYTSPEIDRLALHDKVVDRLRMMLIEGAVAPGAKLNERLLSEQLNVSRTPLREAIKFLAAEGLVELVPNRGAIAIKLSDADLTHTFEVLGRLEGLAGELAAKRIQPDEVAEIQALHFEMLACYAREDMGGYYRLNARIHAAINQAARNPVLTHAYQSINARVQPFRFRTNQSAAEWKRSIEDHERMMAALIARDAAALRDILSEHLEHTHASAREALRALNGHDGK